MSTPSGSAGQNTSYEALKQSVEQRLQKELSSGKRGTQSREYSQFKQDSVALHHTLYEKVARACGKVFAIDPGKDKEKLKRALSDSHLDIKPTDVASIAILIPVLVFLGTVFATVLFPMALGNEPSLYFVVFSMILAAMVYVPLRQAPYYLQARWRQRASNQMVLAVFYTVTYMRHTPNLELAIEFAANHIGPPLSLDMIKVLWDVETGKHSSVSQSLESYLLRWREDALEFVEAMHLIQSSLLESSNSRRLDTLDKSLDVMLEETYEKMLHYAQDLKGPLTMLHMLGIILPVLGLVILPLAVSFFDTSWTVIASLYNVILPFLVYFLGRKILVNRPSGYGHGEISQVGIALEQKRASAAAKSFAILVGGVLCFIGILPLILGTIAPTFDLTLGNYELLGYKSLDGERVGPFGLGAGLISLFFTLGLGLGLGIYYKRKTKSLIKVRERSKRLEQEFASALFQLGNRIGEGIPAEVAFGQVAQMMEGTVGGKFYFVVANNIQRLGMGVEEAIFDPQHGALIQYPSDLIESSMKVLLESSHKGPQEASRALISMSNYIREMHRVDERLRDLLSDVLSSMKSQISFLLPTISGIVIGITSMITTVLGAVKEQADSFNAEGTGADVQTLDLFGLGIPSFYFQIIIGTYVVQVVWTLSYLISGIENGPDKLSEDWLKAKSLVFSTLLYTGIAFAVMLLFNLLAGQIVSVTS